MLENAVRICDAKFGNIQRWDGEQLHLLAMFSTPTAYTEARGLLPHYRPNPKALVGRMMATKAAMHVTDLAADEAYVKDRVPATVAAVEHGGVRTALAVPMLKEEGLIGAFVLCRQEVRPFTDKQIALVANFAAQAVIAIGNARLLNELRQSLEQQTATAEVLKVISSSPGALEPVFRALLENATRLCGASYGNMWLCEGGAFRSVALHGDLPATYKERWGTGALFRPEPDVPLASAAKTREPFQITDIRTSQPYREGNPLAVSGVNDAGILAVLAVPMLEESDLVGVILIYSKEARRFTEKQIKLLQNFAAQAVIAIENARLLNELRQRTTDLTEALEQQTATSEVLQVISGSPGNLEPVFTAMLEKAVRVCGAKFGNAYRWDGERLHAIASQDTPSAFVKARERASLRPGPEDPVRQMITTKQVVHTLDQAASSYYAERDPLTVAAVELGGVRTLLCVPMLRNDELIGAFTLARHEVSAFTDKQIDLVKNFAAQAVIAIENARLLNELRERTDQLAAQSQELAKLNQQLEQRVTDQVGEIERMSRLRRFLPPQVADLIVASGSEKQLESHRREITALFCDLRGFTGFSESADPEDVMTVLREYHEALGASIIKYSGTLERYAGDGVMVVFNDPVPVENPALQAVLMALEMREAIGALTETWHRWGHDIGFGIGIAHGFATLGTIGFEGRFDYAAIGTVSMSLRGYVMRPSQGRS
jgi:GAF domain-containing protein